MSRSSSLLCFSEGADIHHSIWSYYSAKKAETVWAAISTEAVGIISRIGNFVNQHGEDVVKRSATSESLVYSGLK